MLKASIRTHGCQLSPLTFEARLGREVAPAPWSLLWHINSQHATIGGVLGQVGRGTDAAFPLFHLLGAVSAYRLQKARHLFAAGQPASLEVGEPIETHVQRLLPDLSLAHGSSFDFGGEEISATYKSRAGYAAISAEIGSQRRLRVTRGIYLPADVPMHGIFGSKDVIHS